MDFVGNHQPGGWYIYPCTAHLRTPIINQDWVVTAEVEQRDEDHSLVWTLEDSQIARIDFPDELSVPLKLERMSLRSPFVSGKSWAFVGTVISAASLAIFLFAGVVGPRLNNPVSQVAVVVVLVGVKIFLCDAMGVSIMINFIHDDQLFMKQGQSIYQGEWLGEFDELTLAKGPIFPVLLALSAATDLPLHVDIALFHAIAVLLFVAALSPWIKSAGWRLLLFAILIFDPHSFSAEVIGRVLRCMVHPALTLATLAGFLGMVCRWDRQWYQLIAWAVVAGTAGFAFAYSREEGIWLFPSVALVMILAVVLRGFSPYAKWLSIAVMVVIPAVVFWMGKSWLTQTNNTHYGLPIGVDGAENAFGAAHGALLRVDNPDGLPGVPVTAATRQLIYAQSPGFAQLEGVMETHMAPKWSPAGWHTYPTHERSETEIRNGWFAWALRDAAAHLGYYSSASRAEGYWQQVADEINTAVDEGRLEGGRERRGFFPRWDSAYTGSTIHGWFSAWDLIVRITDFRAFTIPSRGTPAEVDAMAELYNVDPTWEISRGDWPGRIRSLFHQTFLWLGWPLTLLALVSTTGLVFRVRTHVTARSRLVILLALWGGVTALCLVVSLVEATSFPAVISSYLAPAAPLVFATWVLAPLWYWQSKNESNETATA